jgi:hypothetical protein
LRRSNFVNRVIYSNIPAAPPNRPTGTLIDLSSWDALATDPDRLIDELNLLLLHGTISDDMRMEVKDVVLSIPVSNRRSRVRAAIYLIATSSQYQVER